MNIFKRLGKWRFMEALEGFEGAEMLPFVAIGPDPEKNEAAENLPAEGRRRAPRKAKMWFGSWASLLAGFRKTNPGSL
ncbi:MAG: hypothetical protein J5I98_19940 [Phaeodactylibacter sp.]|nr:hypothetical protein [Phaeodactylibacter sp.]